MCHLSNPFPSICARLINKGPAERVWDIMKVNNHNIVNVIRSQTWPKWRYTLKSAIIADEYKEWLTKGKSSQSPISVKEYVIASPTLRWYMSFWKRKKESSQLPSKEEKKYIKRMKGIKVQDIKKLSKLKTWKKFKKQENRQKKTEGVKSRYRKAKQERKRRRQRKKIINKMKIKNKNNYSFFLPMDAGNHLLLGRRCLSCPRKRRRRPPWWQKHRSWRQLQLRILFCKMST